MDVSFALWAASSTSIRTIQKLEWLPLTASPNENSTSGVSRARVLGQSLGRVSTVTQELSLFTPIG